MLFIILNELFGEWSLLAAELAKQFAIKLDCWFAGLVSGSFSAKRGC